MLVAGLVHGYTGFGAAMVAMPLLSLVYNPVEALAVTAIVGLAGAAQLSPGAARVAHWPEVVPVMAGPTLVTPRRPRVPSPLVTAPVAPPVSRFGRGRSSRRPSRRSRP